MYTSSRTWSLIASIISFFLLNECTTEAFVLKSFAVSRTLKLQVATEAPHSKSGSSEEGHSSRNRLSRPERKALERKKKQAIKENETSNKSKYSLHSSAVSILTNESTPNEIMRAIKRAQNRHDLHDISVIEKFIFEQTDASFAYGYRGSLLARLAVAAMHLENHELARAAIELRRVEHRPGMLPLESLAIIRGLLRLHNTTDAIEILDDELSLPLQGTPLESKENKERIKHRALALCSIASRHFFEGEPSRAVHSCKRLLELAPYIERSGLTAEELEIPWERLLKGAAECESGRRSGKVIPCENVDVKLPCNLVYSVLDVMAKFPSVNSDPVYELISNALVRRVVFVAGAVSIEGCPPAERGEAAFIGRSNVGKSSLINMITNRKSLAYTSKRPGKTQQFNFFAVNDKPGLEKEIKYGDDVPGTKDLDSFYFVDLPGFGYAKVPENLRRQWSEFMHQYIATRRSLRVVFHLIDSRHGPTDEDANIMRIIRDVLPWYANYVVVLTKADKNVKGASTVNAGRVSRRCMEEVRRAMEANGVGKAPVILSSSETKLGRDELWRYLRQAAES